MLAILGLLGLAVAGTAFVGNLTPEDEGPTAAEDAFDAQDTNPEPENAPDLLQALDFDAPAVDATGLVDAVVDGTDSPTAPFDLIDEVIATVDNTANGLILAGTAALAKTPCLATRAMTLCLAMSGMTFCQVASGTIP